MKFYVHIFGHNLVSVQHVAIMFQFTAKGFALRIDFKLNISIEFIECPDLISSNVNNLNYKLTIADYVIFFECDDQNCVYY